VKYIYNNIKSRIDSQLLSRINSAADSLQKKLTQLDVRRLNISEYNQKYLGTKLIRLTGHLQIHTYLLALALSDYQLPLKDFIIVDYGGGSGILSLLAKELGVGRVIYNDIYDVSCNDIKILAKETNLHIDDIVCGDIDDLITYLNKQSVSIQTICSNNVIEHIYDIEGYLKKLHLLSDSPFRIVFSSTANIKNLLIRKRLKKIHLEQEYQDSAEQWGHKERDSLKSFFKIRKEVITNYDPTLDLQAVEKIAVLTRGLIMQDIEKHIDEYKKNGSISYTPDHPTNTCDPYTGNWAEHLINLEWLKEVLRGEGFFNARVLCGYYGYSSDIFRRNLKGILNSLIQVLGRHGLWLAPYYVVFGNRQIGNNTYLKHS
jgi:2-polyprenyl-3-methyl-5-hydroxy-6-metoxy-1,4-benzoquinol methylase